MGRETIGAPRACHRLVNPVIGEADGLEMLLSLPSFWRWTRDPEAAAIAPPTDQSAAPAAAIAAALPDPCLLLDAEGLVVAANPLAHDILEIDPIGEPLSSVMRSPAILEAVASVRATGAPSSIDLEMRVPLPRQFEVFVSPLGRDGLMLVILRDLTREQRIERMRADFVANASHELRTPLASIMGFIETLQGPAREDAKARETFLATMLAQAGRMKRLIDDLLSLSRIEMNAHLRPTAKVDLSQIARHVCDTLASLAKASNMTLHSEATGPIAVQGDWDELVQVVQNLTENAIKYASAGKRVDIACAARAGMAEIEVRDYGPGIAEEHIPRLTERFYRVNAQESRSRGGTGLGLAIVKHILNRHRGRLAVHSEIGRGCRFVAQIPLYGSAG
jgi:two-component system, OmpR family, phosphate regulon sensor histidine kinase PhoR